MIALRDISEIKRMRAWGSFDVFGERKITTGRVLAWGTND